MKNVFGEVSRALLSLCFLLSGLIKANDPLGFSYKLGEYADYFSLPIPHSSLLTLAAIGVALFEIFLALLLLFGTRRNLTAHLTLLVVGVLTAFTLFILIANPVEDCGCFGDAVKLTNLQTFLKNLVLLALAVIVFWRRRSIRSLLTFSSHLLITAVVVICTLALSLYSFYKLPLVDFRPYKVGADLQQLVLPDEGEPELYDFYLSYPGGGDATADVLTSERPVFLLISPYVEKSNRGVVDQVLGTLDFSRTHGYDFYMVTASTPERVSAISRFLGDSIPVLRADASLLKTIVRSDPGLLLLDRGVVLNKWSCHNLPDLQEYSGTTLEQLSRNKQ